MKRNFRTIIKKTYIIISTMILCHRGISDYYPENTLVL